MYIASGGKDEYNFEESNEKIGAIFVRHPLWKAQSIKRHQLQEFNESYITEDEVIKTDEGLKFYHSFAVFQRTHHPIFAMETFVNAFKAGISPPVSIQESLAKAFQNFLESNAQITLDFALGFKNNRTSARRYLLKQSLEERNRNIIVRIAEFKYLFPQISLSKVCNMFSEVINEELANNSYSGIFGFCTEIHKIPLSSDALIKIFKKSGKMKWYKNYFKEEEEYGELDTSRKAKIAFLGRFPYTSIPPELKDLHPKHNKPPTEKYLNA